jgi:dTDP-4-dehydrorhamnose reductase
MGSSGREIVVIGANGQLGNDICACFSKNGDHVVGLNHDQIEISDLNSIKKAFSRIKPDCIINTAAMHHVGRCEEEPERAFKINGIGSRNLADFCLESDTALVHISTDYVFDGAKDSPYIESDKPLPLNVYGNTKLSGEHFIESIAEKYYILRVSGIYGRVVCRAKGSNFVQTMLKLSREKEQIRVVDDEVLTPTFTEDIARQIIKMIENRAEYGLYHVTSEGSCSWFEFAREIFSIKNITVKLDRAAPGEFAGNIKRPKYCVLENKHLKEQGLNIMVKWQDGLRRYLA